MKRRQFTTNYSFMILTIALFMISVNFLPSSLFQKALSSEQQQEKGQGDSSYSSLSLQPSNDSGTIQCITTPCEFPSPQPKPPDLETSKNDTPSIPRNVTQLPDFPQTDPNNPEPCISPCPPGEICIQMCKPIAEVRTSVSDSGSSEEGQGQQNESILYSDESSDNIDPTNEIEEDTIDNNNEESQDTPEVTESSG